MTEVQATQNQRFLRRAILWILAVNTEDQAKRQRGQITAGLVIMQLLLAAGFTLYETFGGSVFTSNNIFQLTQFMGFGLIVYLIITFIINRRGRTNISGVMLGAFIMLTALITIAATDPNSMIAIMLILPIIVTGLLGPPVSALIVTLVAMAAYILVGASIIPNYFQTFAETNTILQVSIVHANLILVGGITYLFSRATRQALDESRELSLALVEQRELTLDRLNEQTRHLQATIAVTRAIVGSRDVDDLLEDTVNLIRDTFDYYHVQIFLVDTEMGYAILRQSTGEVGQLLLERGHQLAVGSLSVIGQVTSTGQPVVARDTDKDAVHRRNELLLDTRSEMALPLHVGDEIIGALDLQSVEPDAFTEDVIQVLQALADQLAIAIQNARLYEQAEENLRELSELSLETSQRSWAEFLQEARETEAKQSFGPLTENIALQRSRVVERVLQAGTILMSSGSDGKPTYLAVPVVVRNQVIGVLGVEPDGQREWTQEDLRIMEGIAGRASLAIENARLYSQTQRAAERERMISSITEKLQRAPNLAMLLESAASELASALGTDNVYAEISLSRPMAETRKTVTETGALEAPASLPANSEGQDAKKLEEQTTASDEQEEARAEL